MNPIQRYERIVRQTQADARIPALSVAVHRVDRPMWTFSVGDAVLEVVAAAANSGAAAGRGLDHIRIAVKDFNVATAMRVLRERGIAGDDKAVPGSVRLSDPDGLPIELAAAA